MTRRIGTPYSDAVRAKVKQHSGCARALLVHTLAMLVLGVVAPMAAKGQEAEWIWSPKQTHNEIPRGTCYFRKTFRLEDPRSGEVTIGADDSYELFVNARRVAAGGSSRKLDEHDISRFLSRGNNVIAIRVTNRTGSTAALAARVTVKSSDGEWQSYSTDSTWLTQLNPLPLWNSSIYNDSRWDEAQSFGRLGDTAPWDIREGLASDERTNSQRFKVAEGFSVQRLLDESDTGSLIAMTFNEFGHIIASQGGGPLLLIFDGDEDGVVDTVKTYCDKVTNCQGLLALNGDVYATGDGPDGPGLYRLKDKDRDGSLEDINLLVKFTGDSMGEHGAHGLTLGPDGSLYVMIGNHASIEGEFEENSPHRNYYEGELVERYEDPGGHARGIRTPGGIVIRTDVEGKKVELVAGGLRNAYDLAFNREGDLFTFDSDMESDRGTAWYRPTNIYEIVSGGEYGWRSGWAKWPSYFIDSIAPLADAGRGSPTGIAVYNHVVFPAEYHNALFLADWTEGRILTARMKPQGASYSVSVDEFLKGQPLNVTDLEVGPDGAIYFVTGGRTTRGGLYRVSFDGETPAELLDFGEGITAVIRYPQLQSAWARQKVAGLKRELGTDWGSLLIRVAKSSKNTGAYRARALDVMQLFGPAPKVGLLVEMSQAKNETVRAKAAQLLGLHDEDQAGEALVGLLEDNDRMVRRKACEALLRGGHKAPIAKLLPLLQSDDRNEAWAARRLLEQQPTSGWKPEVLASDEHRIFINGALALMITEPSSENAKAVCDRFVELSDGFISDRDFVDMLRVVQVAVERSELQPANLPLLTEAIAAEFPAGDNVINRELVRLLTRLQVTSIMDRYLDYLEGDAPQVDRLHLAFHLRFLKDGWTADNRIRLIRFLEEADTSGVGNSTPLYIRNVVTDIARNLSGEEAWKVVDSGHRWPSAAVGALFKLPKQLSNAEVERLIVLDRKIQPLNEPHYNRLKLGIVAMLARSGGERSLEYMREIWTRDPERRNTVAVGLAQHPSDENWSYLVRSIGNLEGTIAKDVLIKLLEIEKAPAEPKYYRQVILAGLRLEENGALDAVRLLEYWTGESLVVDETDWVKSIKASQDWFHESHPNQLEARLPQVSGEAKYKLDELLKHLSGEEGQRSSAARGEEVFVKADCAKCHRFGNRGETMGPDLTSLRKRFTRRETLESILYPSHVISDQYASKNVTLTDGRTFTGLVASGGVGELLLLRSNGEKLSILEKDVDEMTPSRVSSMPEGLLDELTLDEIADLMAYLLEGADAVVARRVVD